jgi:hypothetical protein
VVFFGLRFPIVLAGVPFFTVIGRSNAFYILKYPAKRIIAGPGCINQMWITSDIKNYSELILRFYWDHEETPSIEVPMGAFFAMGHDFAPHTVNSLPVVVAPHNGLNCYWQMPFRKHARITLENEGANDAKIIAYKFLYKLHDIPEDAAYFHAQYRRSTTRRDYPEHVILDNVKGKGLYVGTYLAWNSFSSQWWGEGEVKFFIDGDTEFPTLCDQRKVSIITCLTIFSIFLLIKPHCNIN